MIERCRNPNNRGFYSYGARGIKVCDRWKRFENFYEDMGDPPRGLSIDRIDNDKGYCKENCRWATNQEQALNTSRNRIFEFNGGAMTASEWAIKIGINRQSLWSRINSGWSVERALTTKVKQNKQKAPASTVALPSVRSTLE